ncbi:hypothetical protein SBRCBS47491_001400 [Sporothrix bragantina]|uniref:UBC core domain-containing protein n=1 Tax=Sporothrix bragantina TaxID=671064 RepID=A0ABP0AY80_9PEZI
MAYGNQQTPISAAAAPLFRRRLMRDIAELCKPPCYPNIKLHPGTDGPDGVKNCCLLLTTKAYGDKSLHLNVQFPANYPVEPPRISMDTPGVTHPNVFGSYICASILNTAEGYTSAYTLKSIAIQLLSFFSSDSVDQMGGGKVQLSDYLDRQKTYQQRYCREVEPAHWKCERCHYNTEDPVSMRRAAGILGEVDEDGDVIMKKEEDADEVVPAGSVAAAALAGGNIDALSNDVLMLVLQELDVDALNSFMAASERVRQLVAFHDVLRQRELQCFCLKSSYLKSDLGVGVATQLSGSYKTGLESEFDLLSREAFATLNVRRSAQSIAFSHWLPLPLSRRHWLRVRHDVVKCLEAIGEDVLPPPKKAFYKADQSQQKRRGGAAGGNKRGLTPAQTQVLQTPAKALPEGADLTRASEVLLSFMTQIVVRLNEDVDKMDTGLWDPDGWFRYDNGPVKSTLRHASEKAIESYFHLFHLLVCLAAEHPQVAADANRRIRSFYVDNRRSKEDCPNLGMLLVALLIADDKLVGLGRDSNGGGSREDLLKAIITEAITRNVVWLLDRKGAGRAELVHLEADNTVNAYRLHHSFIGSKTSYRLLMFMELFRRTARPDGTQSLETVRDGLYHRHGAPPAGAAAHLAAQVRRIHQVNTWPDFLVAMGVTVPTRAVFSDVLRRAVRESMRRGYSQWGLTADEAKSLRDYHEEKFRRGVTAMVLPQPRSANGIAGRGRGRGGRGGRGGGSVNGANGAEVRGTIDDALRIMADNKFGRILGRRSENEARRTVASVQETDLAVYAQWRLQSGEVTFFPGTKKRRGDM